MQIITSREFKINEPTAVALGKFDGIHIGHVELLNHILYQKKNGLKAAVFTFNISAASFFSGTQIKEITTIEEKRAIFEQMGVDILIEYPLDDETAKIPATNFISDILVAKLNMKYIVAGNDVSFGYMGEGNARLLTRMAIIFGYTARIALKVQYNMKDVSSTYVREEIDAGNMETVSVLLGHPYSFKGTVEYGFRLGTKIGFPTMNLYPDPEKILPPYGVYFSLVTYEGGRYEGLTNIGIRPTVAQNGDTHVSVETFLYDFDKDMYGKNIVIHLLSFKRPEVKFGSTEELRNQLSGDVEDGIAYFAGNSIDKFALQGFGNVLI